MAIQASIQWLEVADSTQDVLMKGIGTHDNMSVVAAELQTAGRGQRGNVWLARKGENLTFSMLLRFGPGGFPPLKASGQFVLTTAATTGVASYLESEGIRCSVKWPNDIYVRNRKVCGMLVENVLDGEYVSASVVGIGLNVNQVDFPPELVNPTSMALLSGRAYDLRTELPKLVSCLERSFVRTLGTERLPVPDPGYLGRLYRLGEFHEYVRCPAGTVFEARIVGVTEGGLLQVETRKGELEEFAFKEISYII